MKKYEAPELFVDTFAADTMIASGGGGGPKNDNAGNNQNCWGCYDDPSEIRDGNRCAYVKDTPTYNQYCK